MALMLWPVAHAEACSCGGTAPSSVAIRDAEVAFVGSVVRVDRAKLTSSSHGNADGTRTVTVTGGSGPHRVVFSVSSVFKGTTTEHATLLQGSSTCDVWFKPGETWLVYARAANGVFRTDKCQRTRLVSDAEQDLLYLRNAEAGHPQGIAHGDVFGRKDGPNGRVLSALSEPLQVRAQSATAGNVTTTDRWGPFQLVLPPGDYQVWVERGGKVVSPRSAVRIEPGTDTMLRLVADYEDFER